MPCTVGKSIMHNGSVDTIDETSKQKLLLCNGKLGLHSIIVYMNS